MLRFSGAERPGLHRRGQARSQGTRRPTPRAPHSLPRYASDPELAGDPVVERLEALAAALTPAPDRLAALEAALLAAVPASPSTPQARAVGAGSAWAGFSWRRGARRSLVLGLTGALLIASVSLAATQTDPGEPFYGVRLDIEQIGRPADAAAAQQWDQTALSAREEEIESAGRRGDTVALLAAAAAYEQAIARLEDSARASDQTEHLPSLLDMQLDTLRGILAVAPDAAKAGIERAITAVSAARDRAEGADVTVPATGPAVGVGKGKGYPDRMRAARRPAPTRLSRSQGRPRWASADRVRPARARRPIRPVRVRPRSRCRRSTRLRQGRCARPTTIRPRRPRSPGHRRNPR